ncbi:hypothetical protein CLU79DRAFT_743803 [Phycomyces nitens]|nr:hypothetical protein CLU79DRAFT_743803 [Phycomyces nitens]
MYLIRLIALTPFYLLHYTVSIPLHNLLHHENRTSFFKNMRHRLHSVRNHYKHIKHPSLGATLSDCINKSPFWLTALIL